MAEEKSSGTVKVPPPEKPKPLEYAKNSEEKAVSTTVFISSINNQKK